jgi:hypothetical protein
MGQRSAGRFAGVPPDAAHPEAPRAIIDLRRRSCRDGIGSDSYRVATEIIRRRKAKDDGERGDTLSAR